MENRVKGDSGDCRRRPRKTISSVLGTSLKSGNKKTSKADSTWSQWSDLPMDLLTKISKGLSVADYLSFGHVCRNWRLVTAASKQEFLESQAPMVVVISSRAKKTCFFFDMSSRDTYRTVLPKFSGRVCVGISSGSLIMQSTDLMLTNPMTGQKLEFPRLLQPFPDRAWMSDRCILAFTMPHPDFLVVALSSRNQNLQFCRSRDHQWNFYSFEEKPWVFVDIIAFGSRIYALTNNSQIGVLSLKSPPTVALLELKGRPYLSPHVKLAASDEHLLVVDFMPTRWLHVYRIDLVSSQWVKVDDLGDQTLFLSYMIHLQCCRIRSATSWGGRPNCLYYLGYKTAECNVYSFAGALIESFPVVPANRLHAISALKGWYFPHDSQKMDYVWDDQFGAVLNNA
ncbi:hypothetical protein SLEP1_g19610 [Rubroshorea leprosula]|uniref:F-box domain-containing protein n=1 Tax=Rubroshorea leprosula TaxID=152421 RepID=A0AAV5J8V6_9ROSI|nr:hypothetical protein SLEP1_g19610 [Rubroshorea leprosula]